jgi:phage terminase large subunit GpA-like protein
VTPDEEFAVVVRAAIAAARPDPELHVDQWAERFMVLPKSGPTGGGAFEFSRTPYARRIHQVLSPGHPCKRVVARVASQMFKTQTALNWIAAVAHQAPANILALQPTDGLAKRFSARVSQAIRNVDVLREVFAVEKSRDKRNTTQAKDFRGDSTLYINTAGAAANLAEITARYIFIDEVDRMLSSVDGEGDPVELAEARATQFARNAKFYEVSSPTVKGFSKIDALYDLGTQESYHVPCPHCGHLHELVLENFHFARDPDSGFMQRAYFVCPECGAEIEEHHKSTMLPDVEMGGRATWVAKSIGDGETISVTMSAFYMPVGAITWLDLARQYARAKDRLARGDHEGMQVFYNTRLGLSYQNSESTTTSKQLQDRAEAYTPRVVPDRALVLTMAVDTQADRLEVQIEAWGPGVEHWVVDYLVLRGSPSDPPEAAGSVWKRLDEIRRTPLAHASGGKPILISAYGIDAGGANTQDVYNYGLSRKQFGCIVLHGANRPNRPIMGSAPSRVDVEWNGTKTPGGVELWTVGTDVAKDYLFNRMGLVDGSGSMHFHDKLPDAWFEGLVVEQPRVRYAKGRTIREWIKPAGARNEPLDLSVYNLAIAYQLGLHRWAALDWQRLRDKLVPAQLTRDLFAPPPEPELELAAADDQAERQVAADELAAEAAARTEAAIAETPQPEVVHTYGQPPAAPPPPAIAQRPYTAPAPRRRILSRGIR